MFNPDNPDFLKNPYKYYPLLIESQPLFFYQPWNAWFFFRHSDCLKILRGKNFNRQRSQDCGLDLNSSPLASISLEHTRLFELVSKFILLLDPPVHTRIRGAVQKAFSAKSINKLKGYIESTVSELLENMGKNPNADIITDFAFPLPVAVIEHMLGISVRDRMQFRSWTRKFVPVLDLAPAADQLDEAARSLEEFLIFIKFLINEKRSSLLANPGENDDLLSILIKSTDEQQALSEDEMIATILLLLIAGHETTVHMLGNGVKALMGNTAQKDILLSSPEKYAASTVSEVLRFDSPVQTTARICSEDCSMEFSGKIIQLKKGQQLLAMLGAANRDPLLFDNPDLFNIKRANSREHLAFGNGIHHCLGAILAELEGAIAFPMLFKKFPGIKCSTSLDSLEYLPNFIFHGLKEFPVNCEK